MNAADVIAGYEGSHPAPDPLAAVASLPDRVLTAVRDAYDTAAGLVPPGCRAPLLARVYFASAVIAVRAGDRPGAESCLARANEEFRRGAASAETA